MIQRLTIVLLNGLLAKTRQQWKKNNTNIILIYRKLHREAFGPEKESQLSDEGIRRLLFALMKPLGYRMRTPQVVDAKRCIKYEILHEWYTDRWIRAALEHKHPRLIFNADETEINRKASFKGKIAWNKKKPPRIAAKDRSGSHVSMFIIISGNELVKPSFLLHAGPESFVSQPSLFEDDIVCIKTANGYMEKWTFKNIMIHHFIPHVQKVREELGTDDRAALIVDGHLSRYDLETFCALREAGIDLIILPAHSSHITQPLDITLNGLIKRAFPAEFRKGVPRSVLDDIKMLNEGGTQYRSKQHLFAKPSEQCTRSENINSPPKKRRRSKSNAEGNTAMAITTSTEEVSKIGRKKCRKVKQFSYTAMERLCTLCAIINALSVLKKRNIESSWQTAGLHPFTGKPPKSEDDCNTMLRELIHCENLGVQPRPRTTNSIVIVGLVNNEEGIERFKKLLQEKELKPRKYRGCYNNGTSVIEIVTENEDVGDYVNLDTESSTSSANLYGNTDADCYVAQKNRGMRLFRRHCLSHFASPKSVRKHKHPYINRGHRRHSIRFTTQKLL